MVELSARSMPSRFRKDEDGVLRVITTETSWEMIVHGAFGRLIPYARGDVNVMKHLRQQIGEVQRISSNAELNRLLDQLREATRSSE